MTTHFFDSFDDLPDRHRRLMETAGSFHVGLPWHRNLAATCLLIDRAGDDIDLASGLDQLLHPAFELLPDGRIEPSAFLWDRVGKYEGIDH